MNHLNTISAERPTLVEAVTLLMSINLDLQASDTACIASDSMPPYMYAREMQTVRVDAGRAAGKTISILELAGPDDVVFAYGSYQARMLDEYLSCPVFGDFYTAVNAMRGKNWYNTNVVWIDEASHVSTLDQYYTLFAGKAQQFVLLG